MKCEQCEVLEKKLEIAIRALYKLRSWAKQDPAGPYPAGIQHWVLSQIEAGLDCGKQ